MSMVDPNPLVAFLRTDPRDVGCAQAWEMIHLYAQMILDGQDPEHTMPGITAHLRSCGPCEQDFAGLLAFLRAPIDPTSTPT